MIDLNTNIQFLKGVGEKRAQLLKRLGVDHVGALLRYYPIRYEDWSKIVPVFSDNLDKTVCVKATVISGVQERRVRKNMVIYTLAAEDDSGVMKITIYNSSYAASALKMGQQYLFYGKMEGTPFLREMSSPAVASVDGAKIKPIYRTTKGLYNKNLQNLVRYALDNSEIKDPLPESVLAAEKLMTLKDALENIHFPKSDRLLQEARRRLIFEELFILQAGMIMMKHRKKQDAGDRVSDYAEEFYSKLSFAPTSAQVRAVSECLIDMASGKAMNRLVQGDVGSGKTLVAAALIYSAAKSFLQSALMAPTEILAEQHYETLCKFFEGTDIKCVLITGSLTKKKKEQAVQLLKSGEVTVAVGTHALFSENIEFKNLALVITDEQHRFGVKQRAALSAKGNKPHTLVMSATPIPRTLAMTIYGDLDVSIIDEYPKGRQTIETYAVDSSYRERYYKFIDKHIDEGRQVYIICPLVEASECEEQEESEQGNAQSNLVCATELYEELCSSRFKNRSVGLLHGKMKPKEKYDVMSRFASGEIQILIATTVVEVGIDVPNAALMVIENADRFGLSQLHQLRGRIGRGPFKSTCVLVSDILFGSTAARLKCMCRTRDGFEIAEEDLKLRGPGDFLGERQHGLPELKIADMASDLDVLKQSGAQAKNVIEADRYLQKEENALLRKAIDDLFASIE